MMKVSKSTSSTVALRELVSYAFLPKMESEAMMVMKMQSFGLPIPGMFVP